IPARARIAALGRCPRSTPARAARGEARAVSQGAMTTAPTGVIAMTTWTGTPAPIHTGITTSHGTLVAPLRAFRRRGPIFPTSTSRPRRRGVAVRAAG
ncbi:hypothetical protein, partial [Frankia sp. AgB32]|uniref:hypothetical protein n=1 Tax=Frankia sp. AgB32 TaxID=631119 RepID=UPI0024B16C34